MLSKSPKDPQNVRKIFHEARQVGREGFANMLDKVEEYIEGNQKVLRSEEMEYL